MSKPVTGIIDPPSDAVLDLLDLAFAQRYGHIGPDKAGNPAFIPAMRDIRRVVLPALRRGERVGVRLSHATTIVAVIAAFESKVLDRFVGERTTQRAAMNALDSTLLDTVTQARTWARSASFVLATGRPIAL